MPRKALSITTDVYDNVLQAGRHLSRRNLDDLMAYCAAMGATRHEWIVDTIWTLYDDDGPAGFDLLAEACAAAHRHGMRFEAVFKPFEGALDHPAHTFPSTFPRPAGLPWLVEQPGIVGPVRPFVAAHPEMRMARRPEDAQDPGGRIASIRLIQADDAPAPFGIEALSLWTSSRNGGFRRYDGPRVLHESVEPRLQRPHRVLSCRVLTLERLELPADTRFVLIRCDKTNPSGAFRNRTRDMFELRNERGETLPSTPSRLRANTELLYERECALNRLQLTRYTRDPEVTARLQDRRQFLQEADGMFYFGFEGASGEVSLPDDGEVVIARGKPQHVGGVLCPVYPEVREHWLDEIRFCLERGVDGIGLRPGTHSWAAEPWAYGFNEPVLAHSRHPGDVAEARRVNGEAYSAFMHAASDLVRTGGKTFCVHVAANFLCHVDRNPEHTHVIRNLDWQWERWVRECADCVQLRGTSLLRQENAREVVARVGLVAHEAGVPMIMPGVPARHDCELECFLEHPAITGYMLYESANFTRINDAGEFEGDPDIAARIRRFWTAKGWDCP